MNLLFILVQIIGMQCMKNLEQVNMLLRVMEEKVIGSLLIQVVNQKHQKVVKHIPKKEAKRIVAIMRKKGLNAYYTNGKTANRPLYRAFTATEGKIQAVAEKCFSNIGGGSSSGGGKDWSLKNFISDIKSKTDKLETAMDDPSSLAPQPHMPSIPHAKAPKLPKAKTPKILKNLK